MRQPWFSAKRLQDAINLLRIESTCQKVWSVICTLFVVNRFSLKSITIRECGNILPCAGGENLKSAVTHDAGIARCFDENVFKTELESERPGSLIFPSNDCTRRIEIVKTVRLRNRSVSAENDENPQSHRELERICERWLAGRCHDPTVCSTHKRAFGSPPTIINEPTKAYTVS